MPSALDRLISPADQTRVIEAIRAAEKATSGEIKVHLEARCPGGDPYRRAVALFARLGLSRTRERNGVLFYLATDDRRFCVIGDVGIHEAVGSAFWQEAVDRMKTRFVARAFGEGLVEGIGSVGARLAERFPPRADDQNELSDEISTDAKQD